MYKGVWLGQGRDTHVSCVCVWVGVWVGVCVCVAYIEVHYDYWTLEFNEQFYKAMLVLFLGLNLYILLHQA